MTPTKITTAVAVGRTLGLLSFSPSHMPRTIEQIGEQTSAHLAKIVSEINARYGLDETEVTTSATKIIRSLQTDRTIGVVQFNSTLANITPDQQAIVTYATQMMLEAGCVKNLPDYNRFKGDLSIR